jgi:hypothetical protein
LAQAAIKFSGREAPSRKLKAEREWSSIYMKKRSAFSTQHSGKSGAHIFDG